MNYLSAFEKGDIMKKCIVTGVVTANRRDGGNSFTVLNGDIEVNEQGEEVYITSRQKEDSSESEDVSCLVKDMDNSLQEYVKNNKRWIEV
jgi:hypothetical protein